MSNLLADPHLGFIVAAYGIAVVVIGGMIGSVTLEYRRLSGRLDRATRALEAARGGSRRKLLSGSRRLGHLLRRRSRRQVNDQLGELVGIAGALGCLWHGQTTLKCGGAIGSC